MEKNQDLYEAFYIMENMVDILFADYEEKVAIEEQEKERSEDDASYPSSSEYSSSSSSSYHSNEKINQSLQAYNFELRILLQESEEEKKILQLQL